MRFMFTSFQPPRNPILRALALVGVALVLAGLVALGIVFGAALLAAATIALAVRRWRLRRAKRRGHAAVIEGEFRVVQPRPRAELTRLD